jgi:hypothetical protein
MVPRRGSVIATCLLAAWLTLAAGCAAALTGHWRLVRATPDREVFALDEVEFASDGSYAATITIEGKTAREKGTFRFDGFKLALRPAAGGQREYPALVKLGDLEVRDGQSLVRLQRSQP